VEEENRKSDILKWVRTKIAKKHKKTGITPCPFASKALKDKNYQIIQAKDNLSEQVNHLCDVIDIFKLDIIILHIEYPITLKKIESVCRRAQKRKPDVAVLYDHPENDGLIKGMQFSYQKCPLIMIQPMEKLKAARRLLREKTDYYQKVGNEDMFV